MVSRLKIERIKRELTQTRLADMAGTYQTRLSAIERGKRPDQEEAERIAQAVGVPPGELFGDGFSK
jgi:transcriptional regulator with XRE-family HTH domain